MKTAPDSPNMLYDAEFCTGVIGDAVLAVSHLWDADIRTFWRSTEHRDRETGRTSHFFPTTSLRCMSAVFRLGQESRRLPQTYEMRMLLDRCATRLANLRSKDLRSSLDTRPGKPNLFTLSIYVQALSAMLDMSSSFGIDARKSAAKLQTALGILSQHEDLRVFRRFEERASNAVGPHPFVLFHCLRAIRLAGTHLVEDRLRKRLYTLAMRVLVFVRMVVERLLAKSQLGVLNPAEAIGLAFSGASLALWMLPDDQNHVVEAIRTCLRSQDAAGCWPLGRVVRPNKDLDGAKIEISTYEVAWSLAEATLSLMEGDRNPQREELIRDATQRLILAARYAEESKVKCNTASPPKAGWCSEHAFEKPNIESWTSANVLDELLSTIDLVDRVNREIVLSELNTLHPAGQDWPAWLRWRRYMRDNEPFTDHPILSYIDKKIVFPIREKSGLPSAEARTVSVLLFGPPGTSKTSVAKAVAEGLQWPIVLLNPGSFIEKGLEYIEAESRRVFDRLLSLSKAVVIFDECDELFRERSANRETEQVRSITAFVTASMLPKLQELHDRGRVVFFICTNHVETMDSAVFRPGRIDHVVAVGPPDLRARQRIVLREFKLVAPHHADTRLRDVAIRLLARKTERFVYSELRTASHMLARHSHTWRSANDARSTAEDILLASGEPTIKNEEVVLFQQKRKKLCHAYRSGGS